MTRARPWLSLLVPPLALASSFAVAAVALLASGSATPETVGARLQAAPALPATAGFVATFLVVRWFARREGRTLAALGWSTPTTATIGLGLFATVLFTPVNTFVLFPLVHAADPSFDPSASALSLSQALMLFGCAVVAEETTYRGYALVVLEEQLGATRAVVITSLAYALLAPGPTWPPKLWALGFGLLAAGLRRQAGSLWPVALLHLGASLAPKLFGDSV